MRDWMKERREELNLTQQSVADVIGVSKQYYQLIESGKRQQDLCSSMIMGLAKCFNMSAIEIVNLENEATNDWR